MRIEIMGNKRGKNMNDKNTDQLLKLLNDLAKEIAELKAKQ